ncbi:hypothetical protein H920_20155 [Fukomys damarensis]|uniref:Uncharacterized protein n=1 Tax=Fukomys damarensis TaxID=885580 RepID=A0A091CN20_FUKDA|nr:hypothetical protein H920_20155 [Fukomys damarensis]
MGNVMSQERRASAPPTGLSLPVDDVTPLKPPPRWNNGHQEEPTFPGPRWWPPPCARPPYLSDEEKQSFDWALAWLRGPGPPGCPASSSKAQSRAAENSGKVSERKTCSFGAPDPAARSQEGCLVRGRVRAQGVERAAGTGARLGLRRPGALAAPRPVAPVRPGTAFLPQSLGSLLCPGQIRNKKDFEISALIAVIVSMVAAISATTMATVTSQNQVTTAAAVNQLTENTTQAFKKTALLFQDVHAASGPLNLVPQAGENNRGAGEQKGKKIRSTLTLVMLMFGLALISQKNKSQREREREKRKRKKRRKRREEEEEEDVEEGAKEKQEEEEEEEKRRKRNIGA